MGVCGGCSYPFEKVMAGEAENVLDACECDCTFEMAVYKMQWAYDQLYERFKNVQDEKRILDLKCDMLKATLAEVEAKYKALTEDDGK